MGPFFVVLCLFSSCACVSAYLAPRGIQYPATAGSGRPSVPKGPIGNGQRLSSTSLNASGLYSASRRATFGSLSGVVALPFLPLISANAASTSVAVESLRTYSKYLSEIAGMDEGSFIDDVSSGDEGKVKLPQQISLVTFQKLAPLSKTIQLPSGEPFEAEDFLFVVADYAEAAGAARDLFRLSKLGRIGENGGEDVARDYAKRCRSEVVKASVLADALVSSLS